jgi:hypothetical protein
MRSRIACLSLASIMLAAAATPSLSRPIVRSAPSLPSWLAGCWERRTARQLVEEHWMVPRGGTMLGLGRTTRGDSLVEFEHTRIYRRGDRLVYAANPSGQTPAEFESIHTSDSAVIFENKQHDFPQRVIYRRRGADSLLARVEGTMGGQVRGVDFPYARASCVP